MDYLATGIGSLSHNDSYKACQDILLNLNEVPFWPQLPKISFKENMYVQFGENFPGLVFDENKKIVYVDTENNFSSALEQFYTKFLEQDLEYFKMNYAKGFNTLLLQLKEKLPPTLKFVKGQIIGPISFGLTLTDQNKKALFYDPILKEVIVKFLSLKAKWQIKKIKEVFQQVIIFIDEPYLVSIGSAYVSLNQEEVIRILNEIIETIHSENVLAGIHCCGATDWSIILKTKIDILSFDAYNYYESFATYTSMLNIFLDKGGKLAWGIIPTSSDLEKETAESLFCKFKKKVELLINKGISKNLLKSGLITGSCGAGSLSLDLSQKVLKLSNDLVSMLNNCVIF